MFLVLCSCLCPIHWSQVLSQEWRCSWSSADRRCSNYIWVINNVIAYEGATYIRCLTVCIPSHEHAMTCQFWTWPGPKLQQRLDLEPLLTHYIYIDMMRARHNDQHFSDGISKTHLLQWKNLEFRLIFSEGCPENVQWTISQHWFV